MRYGYALCALRNQGCIGQWYETVRVVSVDPIAVPMGELKHGLRPWVLESLRSHRCRDAWYCGFLVELDEGDCFDTYDPIHCEDVAWFHECEYVPAS